MYFAMYDRHLNSIGETYILERWTRVQRAIDYDDTSIVGEQIPYSAEPFLVTVNDKQGHMLFSGLAGSPSIDEKSKKTTISFKDYRTLWNSDILVDFSKFTGTTVADYLNFILTEWLSQVDVGFSNIVWDNSALRDMELQEDIEEGTSISNVRVYDEILNILTYYNVFCVPHLSIAEKSLSFNFYPSNTNHLSLRLTDTEIGQIEKSFGDYNRITIYDSSHNIVQKWALTSENQVVRLPSDKTLVYPAKNKNFIATDSDIQSVVYDAVMSLAQNRYQESIDLYTEQHGSVFDSLKIDFSYVVSVYTSEGYYKDLPVGEIETNSDGLCIVRLGYRVQELTQEI